jgi:TolA-binding protein
VIEYPGAGWVYLGEADAGGLFLYLSREPDRYNPRAAKTTFTLRAQKTGTALLHFYREDVITNTGTDDYIEAAVTDTGAGKTSAPAYRADGAAPFGVSVSGGTAEPRAVATGGAQTPAAASPQPNGGTNVANGNQRQETALANGAQSAGQTPIAAPPQSNGAANGNQRQETALANGALATTVIQDSAAPQQNTAGSGDLTVTPSVTQPDAADAAQTPPPREDDVTDLYESALQAYNAKNYQQALDLINDFLPRTHKNIDKGLFLKGQILESDSDAQNIKEAREAYSRIVSEFPASDLWQEARNRITYLNRFYFDIR